MKKKIIRKYSFHKGGNTSLKNKVNILTNYLAWFLKRNKIPKILLGLKNILWTRGIGSSQLNSEKYYKNFFIKLLVHQNHL